MTDRNDRSEGADAPRRRRAFPSPGAEARRVAAAGAVMLALFVVPGSAGAQDSPLGLAGDETLLDRVVAVVGDSAILMTEVEERFRALVAQGLQMPDDPLAADRIARDILETLVNEQLVIQAAARDSAIVVDEERIEQVVEDDIQSRIRSFGSRAAFQDALQTAGQSLTAFRDRLRRQARRQLLIEQFMAEARRSGASVEVTEEEMRAFFEQQRGTLDRRPSTLSFVQILVRPSPSDSAEAAALREAERIRNMIVSGEQDFETAARRFSQDPGTAKEGGDLGWFRRGNMVQEFEDVVFSLGNGQVSPVVKTEFGYHVIRLDRSRGAERKARHILIQPGVGPADVERARERAQEAKERLAEGANFQEVRRELGVPEVPDTIQMPLDRLGELPPGYAQALSSAAPGDLVGPMEWQAQGRTNFSVMEVLEVREAGEFTFEDVEDRILSTLREEKLRDKVLQDLREGTYVDIRM